MSKEAEWKQLFHMVSLVIARLDRIESRLPAEGQGPLTTGEFDRIKTQADELQAALKASEDVER